MSGGNDVEVKFGGSTTDLDNASNRAVKDIKNVSNSASGLNGAFAKASQGFKSMIADFKSGWAVGWTESMKNAGVEAVNFGGKAGGAFSEAAAGAAGLSASLVAVGIAAAMIAPLAAVTAWGSQFGDTAERLDQLSAKLGMSAQDISRWGTVMQAAGKSVEMFASSSQRLGRAAVMAASGGKQQQAVFEALGIDITKTTSTSEMLIAISDKFSKMEDGPKKTALAMAAMGRGGAEMIPILNQGSAALKEQFGLAEQYGAVVSENFMQSGRAVDDAMDQMSMGMTGLKNLMFEALAPVIVVCAEAFNQLVKIMIDSYRTGGFVKIIAEAIAFALKGLVTILLTVGTGFVQLWHVANGALKGILGTIGTVGDALARLLAGDFSGIRTAWVNGMKGTGAAAAAEFNAAGAAGKRYYDNMKRLWSGGQLGPSSPTKPIGKGGDLGIEGLAGGGGSHKKGKSAEQLAAEQRRIAEQALRDEIEDLNYKQDLQKENYEEQMRIEQEKLNKLKAFYGEDSRDYTKELRNKARMERDHAQELLRIAQARINAVAQAEQTKADTSSELSDIQLQSEKEHFDALDQMGLVSDQQRIAQMREFAAQDTQNQITHENEIYRIKMQSLRDQLALQGLPVEEQRRINQELEQLEVEHQGKMSVIQARAAAETKRINDRSATQTMKKWQGIIDPISNAFNGFLQGILIQQQSLGQALLAVGDQLFSQFISWGVKMLANWIATQLGMTAVHEAQAGVRAGTDAATAAATMATGAAARFSEVMGLAAVAAAAAFASTAAIPIVGPALAPGAAAAAYGATAAFAPLAVAEGGFDIPRGANPLTQLHQEEMVLPAKFANPLRSMLGGIGPMMSNLAGRSSQAGQSARESAGGRNGDTLNFHYGPKHTNMGASLESLLKADGRSLRKWIKNEIRNGTLKLGDGK